MAIGIQQRIWLIYFEDTLIGCAESFSTGYSQASSRLVYKGLRNNSFSNKDVLVPYEFTCNIEGLVVYDSFPTHLDLTNWLKDKSKKALSVRSVQGIFQSETNFNAVCVSYNVNRDGFIRYNLTADVDGDVEEKYDVLASIYQFTTVGEQTYTITVDVNSIYASLNEGKSVGQSFTTAAADTFFMIGTLFTVIGNDSCTINAILNYQFLNEVNGFTWNLRDNPITESANISTLLDGISANHTGAKIDQKLFTESYVTTQEDADKVTAADALIQTDIVYAEVIIS